MGNQSAFAPLLLVVSSLSCSRATPPQTDATTAPTDRAPEAAASSWPEAPWVDAPRDVGDDPPPGWQKHGKSPFELVGLYPDSVENTNLVSTEPRLVVRRDDLLFVLSQRTGLAVARIAADGAHLIGSLELDGRPLELIEGPGGKLVAVFEARGRYAVDPQQRLTWIDWGHIVEIDASDPTAPHVLRDHELEGNVIGLWQDGHARRALVHQQTCATCKPDKPLIGLTISFGEDGRLEVQQTGALMAPTKFPPRVVVAEKSRAVVRGVNDGLIRFTSASTATAIPLSDAGWASAFLPTGQGHDRLISVNLRVGSLDVEELDIDDAGAMTSRWKTSCPTPGTFTALPPSILVDGDSVLVAGGDPGRLYRLTTTPQGATVAPAFVDFPPGETTVAAHGEWLFALTLPPQGEQPPTLTLVDPHGSEGPTALDAVTWGAASSNLSSLRSGRYTSKRPFDFDDDSPSLTVRHGGILGESDLCDEPEFHAVSRFSFDGGKLALLGVTTTVGDPIRTVRIDDKIAVASLDAVRVTSANSGEQQPAVASYWPGPSRFAICADRLMRVSVDEYDSIARVTGVRRDALSEGNPGSEAVLHESAEPTRRCPEVGVAMLGGPGAAVVAREGRWPKPSPDGKPRFVLEQRLVVVDLTGDAPAESASIDMGPNAAFATDGYRYRADTEWSATLITNRELVRSGNVVSELRARPAEEGAPRDVHELVVIDVTVPSAPTITTVPLPKASWYGNLRVSGSTAAMASITTDGADERKARFHLHRYDLSNPTAPLALPVAPAPGQMLAIDPTGTRAAYLLFEATDAPLDESPACFRGYRSTVSYDAETSVCRRIDRWLASASIGSIEVGERVSLADIDRLVVAGRKVVGLRTAPTWRDAWVEQQQALVVDDIFSPAPRVGELELTGPEGPLSDGSYRLVGATESRAVFGSFRHINVVDISDPLAPRIARRHLVPVSWGYAAQIVDDRVLFHRYRGRVSAYSLD